MPIVLSASDNAGTESIFSQTARHDAMAELKKMQAG
jgi:hypothetical protein